MYVRMTGTSYAYAEEGSLFALEGDCFLGTAADFGAVFTCGQHNYIQYI